MTILQNTCKTPLRIDHIMSYNLTHVISGILVRLFFMLALTGLDVSILVAPPFVGVCFLAILWFPRNAKNKTMSPSLLQTKNTMQLFNMLQNSMDVQIFNWTTVFQLSSNLVFHVRTKHIRGCCYLISDKVDHHTITLPYMPSHLQLVAIFTKVMRWAYHTFLIYGLMLYGSSASIWGAVSRGIIQF